MLGKNVHHYLIFKLYVTGLGSHAMDDYINVVASMGTNHR